MTGERFVVMWRDRLKIRQAVVNIAKSFTRNRKSQAWLLRKAWITLAEAPWYWSDDAYISTAYAVMRHNYEIYVMELPKRHRSDDPGTRRATRKMKKFVLRGGRPPKKRAYISKGAKLK
jgi:hypothetical protein